MEEIRLSRHSKLKAVSDKMPLSHRVQCLPKIIRQMGGLVRDLVQGRAFMLMDGLSLSVHPSLARSKLNHSSVLDITCCSAYGDRREDRGSNSAPGIANINPSLAKVLAPSALMILGYTVRE